MADLTRNPYFRQWDRQTTDWQRRGYGRYIIIALIVLGVLLVVMGALRPGLPF